MDALTACVRRSWKQWRGFGESEMGFKLKTDSKEIPTGDVKFLVDKNKHKF